MLRRRERDTASRRRNARSARIRFRGRAGRRSRRPPRQLPARSARSAHRNACADAPGRARSEDSGGSGRRHHGWRRDRRRAVARRPGCSDRHCVSFPAPRAERPTRTSAQFSQRAKTIRARTEKFSGKLARGIANRFMREMPKRSIPADRISGAERVDRKTAPGVGEGRQPGFLQRCGRARRRHLSRALPAAELIAQLEHGNHRRDPTDRSSFVKE